MKKQKIEITNGYDFGFQFGMGLMVVVAIYGVAFMIQQYYQFQITK